MSAVGAAGAVQTRELRVGRRVDIGLDLEREGPGRRLRDGQPLGRRDIGVRCCLGTVDLERSQRHFVAVEHQWRSMHGRIVPERELGLHPRAARMQREVEVDRVHEPVGLAVIFEADGLGDVGAHGL